MQKSYELRNLGLSSTGFKNSKENWWEIGQLNQWVAKYLPNDIAAIFALNQLKNMDLLQARRKQIYERYQKELSGIDWLITEPTLTPGFTHSYFTYMARIMENRNGLARYLKEKGVYTTLRFYPLNNTSNFAYKSLANTQILAEQGLNLPLHPRLTDSDVDKIIDLIKKWEPK